MDPVFVEGVVAVGLGLAAMHVYQEITFASNYNKKRLENMDDSATQTGLEKTLPNAQAPNSQASQSTTPKVP